MLIEIDGLRVSFGDTLVLHDVHLSLGEGEIYGLLGPNGAGKSTTIAVALGLVKPDAGKVRVFGKNPRIATYESYGRYGVLPEQNGFYDWMSGEEYLAFFAALHGRRLGPKSIHDHLARVGLDPRPRQAIGTYSRGMRQRLGLARALFLAPELLILDEPTNGLDPRGRREIHDILVDLAEHGVGILLCTHLLDDVDRLCRRVGIIIEGRTIAEGSTDDLVRDGSHLSRFRLRLAGDPPVGQADDQCISVVAHEGDWWVVDLDPAITPDTAWGDLFSRGWRIVEIQRGGGGLEDLYLSLTERRAA